MAYCYSILALLGDYKSRKLINMSRKWLGFGLVLCLAVLNRHIGIFGPVYSIYGHRNATNIMLSVANPLHIFEQNLLAAAIIKLGGAAIGMAGDSLCCLKSAIIFQKI